MEHAHEEVPNLDRVRPRDAAGFKRETCLSRHIAAHCEWMIFAVVGSRNSSIFFPLLSVTLGLVAVAGAGRLDAGHSVAGLGDLGLGCSRILR